MRLDHFKLVGDFYDALHHTVTYVANVYLKEKRLEWISL